MLLINKNAMYIWLMYLVFSLFGMVILIYDSLAAAFSGSLVYGLGDGLGYIIIYYLYAAAIKRSKSFKMYKLSCLVLFIEYFFISGLLSRAFGRFDGPRHLLALNIVLILCSACFLLIPLLQRKLFDKDWTDGLHLKDMAEFKEPLAKTEAINIKDHLNLTEREQDIFTMLLKGISPKEIAYTLKISYHTVVFHRRNLYRKMGVQCLQELFVKYS
jgi:DNA-binding CsgD family transcriptional regulator